MFIKEALAETTTAAISATNAASAEGASSIAASLLPLFLILAVFYFIVIRPQNKRIEEHRKMISDLKKGDKVLLGGGVIGKLKKIINDTELLVEIAEGVEVHALKAYVAVLKEKPAEANNDNKK